MKRFFLIFLLGAIFSAFTTFSGLTMFGMHEVMAASNTHPCKETLCTAARNMGSTETQCLDHCLNQATTATTGVLPTPLFSSVMIIVLALAVFQWSTHHPTSNISQYRWREGIGKLIRQCQISTVILRG